MRQTLALLITALALSINLNAQCPSLILGGELGNSSASCTADIERIFPQLRAMQLNTVLVPAYWDLTEPTEGNFDFTLTDKVITTAQANDLKVIFLWFGAWKNSMSCYTPAWFKTDYQRFPRAVTADGKPLEIASAFAENVFKADSTAFAAWLRHINSVDANHTVVMLQIENEIGMLESARDHSSVANEHFKAQVPADLTAFLKQNKASLHPQMARKWNGKTSGTWVELFGNDIYTDEIFMAYHYARYVERMAQTARQFTDIPLYVNAAMNSRDRQPGQYPSAGPLAHLIDVWHAAAPSLAFLSPDIYDDGFPDWIAQYHRPNNTLFIPEMKLSPADGAQAFYAIAEHDALGTSPFSIENASGATERSITRAYAALRQLAPIIEEHSGKGTMHGLLFQHKDDATTIADGDLRITAKHFFTLPWDARATDGSPWPTAGGMIIRLDTNEYIVAGCGIVVTFESDGERTEPKNLGEDGFAASGSETVNSQKWNAKQRTGILSVDQIAIDDNAQFQFIRRLNGDEDHQGRHVRIGVDEFSILHVKLYQYQ